MDLKEVEGFYFLSKYIINECVLSDVYFCSLKTFIFYGFAIISNKNKNKTFNRKFVIYLFVTNTKNREKYHKSI